MDCLCALVLNPFFWPLKNRIGVTGGSGVAEGFSHSYENSLFGFPDSQKPMRVVSVKKPMPRGPPSCQKATGDEFGLWLTGFYRSFTSSTDWSQ